jgi:hypothetical protein
MCAVLGHEIIRSRKTAAEPIGVGFKAPNELMLPISSFKPHGIARRGRPPGLRKASDQGSALHPLLV